MGAKSTNRGSRGLGLNKIIDGRIIDFFSTRRTTGITRKPISQYLVEVYLWGSTGSPGRGGAPQGGGFSYMKGFIPATSPTTIGYIVGQRGSATNFFNGGPGPNGGGAFSAVFLGDVTSTPARTLTIGVAGGAGAGGNDGYTVALGGYGGGLSGGPNFNSGAPVAGDVSGGTQIAGGSGYGTPGTEWLGGINPAAGGGGGGWYGGGAGRSFTIISSYQSGGGGGSGYVLPASSSLVNGSNSYTALSTVLNSGNPDGTYNTTGSPEIYTHTAGTAGKVVIVVENTVVVNTTSAPPGSAVNTYVVQAQGFDPPF